MQPGGFAQVGIDQGQLLGQGVELTRRAVERLGGFLTNQIQLARQLRKARGQSIGAAQKTAALNGRGRVGGQAAGRREKLVQRRRQAHAFVAHQVHDALAVVDQGVLAHQVAGAFAQIGFGKFVVLAFDRGEHHPGSQVAVGGFGRGVGLQRHVLA